MPPPPLSEQFWDARHPPANPTHLSFKGKTVLVTGANTGMGFQAALKYAQLGTSTLILAVRDASKGEEAKARITRDVTTGLDIIIKAVDLSTFNSVKEFAQDINKSVPALHVVELCAGIMSPSFATGAEGYENSFQVSILSTALMAILLLENVQQTAAVRGANDGYIPHVTFLNSSATQDVLEEWIPEDQTLVQRINDPTKFDHVSQYYLVKLAARYFIEGLAAHCSKSSPGGETNIIVNCCCPAMCRGTGLHRDYPWYVKLLMIPYNAICGRDPEHGSRTLVSAAGLGRESHGKFWFNDALPEYAGFMATERSKNLGKETNEEILKILREKAGLKGYLSNGGTNRALGAPLRGISRFSRFQAPYGLLMQAANEQQKTEIITDVFLSKIRSILQLNDNQPLLSLSSDAIGLDSIIAVDIQSWLRQELKVEISILDVVNSRTLSDLVRLVSDLFLADHALQFAQDKPTHDTHDIATVSTIHESIEEKAFSPNENIDYHNAEGELSGGTVSPTISTLDTVNSDISTAETPNVSQSQERKLAPEKIVPLSFAQSRFWFLNSFTDHPASFNVTTLITLKGHLDPQRLSSALNAVTQRHEALRTVFFFDENEKGPVQGILPASTLHLEWEATSAGEETVEATIRDIESHPFNFLDGPLLRMKLVSLFENTHYIVLGYHHIVMDGIGFDIFCSDLDSAYRGELNTNDEGLLQYPDFALRQLDSYKRGLWGKSIRPESLTFNSHKISFRLPKPLENNITRYCQTHSVNKFHFHLATFAALLFRFTGGRAKDVCIGVADGNRKQQDTLKCLGLFLNLLPLRIRNATGASFVDTLKATQLTSDNAFLNSGVPFDVILQELNAPRSPTTSPIFQAFMNYRPNVHETRKFLGCVADGKSLSVGENAYDVSLDILESRDRGNLVTMIVNVDLYSIDSPQVLGRSYINLLHAFAQDPTISPIGAPLHNEEDVSTAIRIGQGIQKDAYVGILQALGIEWVCSFLAVIRTGATCVPLDLEVGIERLRLITQDCCPSLILCDSSSEKYGRGLLFEGTDVRVMDITEFDATPATPCFANRASPGSRMMITYTSGTT
ncbi:hypothetical protein E0Z10_g10656, partial [Xylaria hypoxylon]